MPGAWRRQTHWLSPTSRSPCRAALRWRGRAQHPCSSVHSLCRVAGRRRWRPHWQLPSVRSLCRAPHAAAWHWAVVPCTSADPACIVCLGSLGLTRHQPSAYPAPNVAASRVHCATALLTQAVEHLPAELAACHARPRRRLPDELAVVRLVDRPVLDVRGAGALAVAGPWLWSTAHLFFSHRFLTSRVLPATVPHALHLIWPFS